jgi:hypothetical protein
VNNAPTPCPLLGRAQDCATCPELGDCQDATATLLELRRRLDRMEAHWKQKEPK